MRQDQGELFIVGPAGPAPAPGPRLNYDCGYDCYAFGPEGKIKVSKTMSLKDFKYGFLTLAISEVVSEPQIRFPA